MAPRLSGHTSIFGVVFFVCKSFLGIERQKKLEIFAILTRKPRCHVRTLIYRTWPIKRSKVPMSQLMDECFLVPQFQNESLCATEFDLHEKMNL